LLDALDDQRAHGLLPLACRSGNCGACLVRVVAGAELLDPAAGEERAALSQLGCGPDMRLGCQIHARIQPFSSADPACVILRIGRSPA
jgi:ferredoxin